MDDSPPNLESILVVTLGEASGGVGADGILREIQAVTKKITHHLAQGKCNISNISVMSLARRLWILIPVSRSHKLNTRELGGRKGIAAYSRMAALRPSYVLGRSDQGSGAPRNPKRNQHL